MVNEPQKQATTAIQSAKKETIPQQFRTLNLLEEMNTVPVKIPSLVDDFLLEVGVSMLTAKPKTGKSTLALQLAVAVADGKPFLGKPTLTGDVLYLMLEGPKGSLLAHAKKMGYSGTKHGSIHLVHDRMPPKQVLGLEKLTNTIKALPKLRLVIIDPGPKLLRLVDSYKPKEPMDALEELENIAKLFKLHLMFLMHGKKTVSDDQGDATMGSTSFRGGTDTNIYLTKTGEQRVISSEQRWGIALEPTVLRGWNEETQTVELGETLDDAKAQQAERKEKKTLERIEKEILHTLAGESLNQSAVLAKVTGKTTTKLKVLENLAQGGVIRVEEDGKEIIYRLSEMSREESQSTQSMIVVQEREELVAI